MDGFVLEEKSFFRLYISIAETASKKIGTLILSMKFFLLRLLLSQCIDDAAWHTMMKGIWLEAGLVKSYRDSKLQRVVGLLGCWNVGLLVLHLLDPLAHRRNEANFKIFFRYLIDVHLNWQK